MTTFGSQDACDLRQMIIDAEEIQAQALYDQDYCEKRQTDIMHQLEFCDMSYHQRAKLATELVELRRKRRAAKNQLYLIDPFIKWKDNNAKAINQLSVAIGDMRKIEERQSNMTYTKKIGNGVIEHVG